MSAKIINFPEKISTWNKLLVYFENHPNKIGYYNGLLKWLKNKEESMGPNPIVEDWLEIRNKISQIENKLKEA